MISFSTTGFKELISPFEAVFFEELEGATAGGDGSSFYAHEFYVLLKARS